MRLSLLPVLCLSLVFVACDPDDGDGDVDTTPALDVETDTQMEDTAEPPSGPAARASCSYRNPFGQTDDCKEYLGEDWTDAQITEDCATVFPGVEGGLKLGEGCDDSAVLGACVNTLDGDKVTRTLTAGTDAGNCAATQTGCEAFGGGEFVPDTICGGGSGGPDTPAPLDGVFAVPYERCEPPVAGEAPGDGPGGDVCTKNSIQGCTEEGRKFEDYASCSDVLTQRPYWSNPLIPTLSENDPRLTDSTYETESNWVKSQIEACSCVCCHADSLTPSGVGQWDTEFGPLWADTFSDSGMAMMAGWVGSDGFGAYPAAENNGFDREITGAPSTDVPRMIAFFEGELARRGKTRADFAETPPFGEFMYTFIDHEPGTCGEGIGVDRNGVITWNGGAARYIYLLEAGSKSPAAPPSFDMPDGVVYRLDVAVDQQAVTDGFTLGDTVEGASQRVPANGAPVLEEGKSYYLHVSKDMLVPVTRCLFEY